MNEIADQTGGDESTLPAAPPLKALLEELVEDNTTIVAAIKRLADDNQELRGDFARSFDLLREDLTGALSYRVLRDLCQELFPLLSAMEGMLDRADFSDGEAIRGHVDSVARTLRSALDRMGAQKIGVAIGEESFDPSRHHCLRVVAPSESPFPSAAPRVVVAVLEDGYTLAGRVLAPAKVQVQAGRQG